MGSKHLGTHQNADFLLTHIEWNSMNEMFSRGSNETGIRRMQDGEEVADSFTLIQHGWHDWDYAGQVILRQLGKGWSTYRIERLMDFMKSRGLHWPVSKRVKARVA